MSSTHLTDAWGREVTISNGLFRYRNRAIDIREFGDIRVKGRRVLINHFKENIHAPRAIIICKDVDSANKLYEYILSEAYPPQSDEKDEEEKEEEEGEGFTVRHVWANMHAGCKPPENKPTENKPTENKSNFYDIMDDIINSPMFKLYIDFFVKSVTAELLRPSPPKPLTLWQYLGCSRRYQTA